MAHTYKNRLAVVFTLLFLLLFSSVQVYAEVDLVINLSDSPDPVAASGFVTYSISIENNGDSTSDTTSLAVTIPATTTYSTFASTDGVTCDDPGGVLTCEFGSLLGDPTNQRKTVDIEIQTLGKGIITLWATASTSGTDDTPDTANSDSEDTTVYQGADVALVKTASVAAAPAGSSLSYSFAVTNNGPDAATMLRIGDQIYSGFNLTSLPSECSNSGGTIICDLDGSIASGETRTIGPISGIITSAGGSTITNAATVALQPFPGSAATDPNTDDNTSTVDTDVTAGSDVKISKSRSVSGSLLVGAEFNFILSPSYSGDSPQNLTVTDSIPANYTIQSGSFLTSQNGWECGFTGQDVTCTRPAGGDSGVYNQAIGNISIPVEVATSDSDPVVNSTTIETDSIDPDPSNDTATDGGANLLDPTVDLGINKTGPVPALVVVGVPFNFNVNVNNTGTTGFYGTVNVTDTIPANMTITSYTHDVDWSCLPAAPVGSASIETIITCSRTYDVDSPLAAGATSSSIVMTAETATSGTFINNATITTPDCNLATCNDGDTDSYSVISSVALDSADISVIKRVISPDPVLAGDELTYSLEVVNSGPDPSIDVRLTDTFSSLINDSAGAIGAGFIAAVSADGLATPGECTYSESGRTLSCNYASVPVCVAGSDCPVVTVRVRPGGDGGERSNTANVISYGTADPDHSNETSTVTSNVTPRADITVVKEVTPSDIAAGQNLTYVVTVHNNGPSRAEDVIMTDTLPADVTFVSAASSVGPCGATPTVESTTTSGNDTVICNLNSIDNGSQQTVTLVVRPNTVTSGNLNLTNYAEAITSTLETDGLANDVNPNNFDSASASVLIPSLDLVLNKDDSLDPVAVGEQTIYTIDVTNSGPSAAEDVVVTDTLPSIGLSFVSASSSSGSCPVQPTPGDDSGADVICDLGYMASNTQQTITVVMQGEVKGGYTNIASVTSNETGLNYENSANNSVEEQTTVRTKADMAVISKIAYQSGTSTPSPTVNLREDFDFVIRVQNLFGTGLAEADDVLVTDDLPEWMELTGTPTVNLFFGDAPTLTSCTGVAEGTSFSCSLGTVTSNTVIDITVPVQLVKLVGDDTVSEEFVNEASVTTSSLDVNLDNNENTGSVTTGSSTISGRVFRDFNADGSATGGDSGIEGVTMTLEGESFDGADINGSATTNDTGYYTFYGLPASDVNGYTITEGSLVGVESYLNDGTDTAGSAGGDDTTVNDQVSGIVLVANTAEDEYLFAEIPIARIGIAKSVSSGPTVDEDDGTFLTTFQLTVENFSLEPLNDILIEDTLSGAAPLFGDYVSGGDTATLSTGQYTIQVGPTGGCGGLNAGFDGDAAGSISVATIPSLAATTSCNTTFVVRARPTAPLPAILSSGGRYENQASIIESEGEWSGQNETTNPLLKDVSDDGANPDSSGDGRADGSDESDPTPVAPVYNPEVTITKTISGGVSKGDNNSFIVPIQLTIENTGNEPLRDVAVTDTLSGVAPAFGAFISGGDGASLIPGSYTIQTTPSGSCGGLNSGFDGNATGTTELADFAAFDIEGICTIDFTYRFMPTASTSYTNTANVVAVSDYSVTDVSDTDPIAIPYPRIGLAKRVVDSTTTNANGDDDDGTVSVPFSFVVENLGGETLSGIVLTDDLTETGAQFGVYTSDATLDAGEYNIESGPDFSGSCSGTANASYNGGTIATLATISSLPVTNSCTVTVTVKFRPEAPLPAGGNYLNQGTVTGVGDSSGLLVSDLSDDGTDTDFDIDGIADEAGENDPTPVNVSFTPQIALSKSINSPDGTATTNDDGTVTVPFRIKVTNSGTEPLIDVSVSDTLAGVAPLFGVVDDNGDMLNGEYTIDTIPTFNGTFTTGSLTSGYEGDAQNELAFLDRLEVSDSCEIDFTLRFKPISPLPPGGYSNQATTSGTGEFSDGDPVTDLSQNGLNPDLNGDGDPTNDNDPTPVAPSHTPAIGISKELTVGTILATNEGYRGTFELVVENLGNEELLDVRIYDAMNSAPSNLGTYIPGGSGVTLAAGQYTIESEPVFDTACTNTTANGGFTGAGDTLLGTISELAIDGICSLEYGFRFVPQPGVSYFNQATAAGTGAFSENPVNDLSDAGTDPDTGEDDPTPIAYPRIGLAKQVVGSSTTDDDGTVTVPFSFVIENLGGETLNDIVLTDDLTATGAQFGIYTSETTLDAGEYNIESGPDFSGSCSGTANAGYNGGTNTTLANIGSFASGATCTLTTTIRFRPGLPFPAGGNYENQAEVTATGASSGIPITDQSDDGADPDTDTDGVGNEPGENDPTLVPVTLTPQIALNKVRTAAETINTDGTVTVPFRIKVTNNGTEPLINVTVSDILSGFAPRFGTFLTGGETATLSNGQYTIETPPSLDVGCTNGSLTDSYDGVAAGQPKLATLTRLEVLDSCEIDFTLRFKPTSPLPEGGYSNQGTATADGEFSSTPVTDLSQDGTNPDDPAVNNDPTPVNPSHTAGIGIAKTLQSGLLVNGNGSYSGTFRLVVENLGNEELLNVSINDAMDSAPSNLGSFVLDGEAELVAGQYTIESAPEFIGSCDNSAANGSFNGALDQQLASISELAIGTSCTLEYGFRFVPEPGISYLNQATAAGTGAFSAGLVNDLSDDGSDPDLDGDMNANEDGENDPTPVPIPRIGLAKSAGAVVNNGNGTYDVPFVLTLINAGETALASVQISDDLAEFGSYTAATVPLAGEYTISSDPTIDSSSNGAALTAVATGSFTGEGAGTGLLVSASSSLPNFISGSESAAEIHFTLRFFPTTPGPFNNSAVATGSSSAGGDVTDDSVSGSTPDADGNGDPGDDESPTVVTLSGQVIGVAKAVGSIVQLTTKSYDIPYSLILVNPSTTITATNVQLSDNLSSTFPTAASVSISSAATISACSGTVLNVAVSPFDGTTQTQLLVGNQNLQPTEQCTISFTARVDFGSNPLPEVLQNNSAVATTAETAGGIQIASDLSDNGIVPDPNDNGNASDSDENDPTPVDFSSSNLSSVSGTIWVDSNHDRIDNDGAATNLPTFSVEVLNSAGNIVGTATSDENGNYSVDSLFPSTIGDPSTYYDVRFRESISGAIYGNPLSQDPANPNGTIDDGIINALQLVPGTNTVQQDLPLDPSGVVYDSVTRIPVAGATVTLGYTGSEFFDPSIHLVGGAANVTQVTGVSGFYQYILLGTAPDGDYSLTTTPPPGYVPTPSVMIPVCVNSPSVGANPNPALVQISADPPLASAPVHNPSTCPTDSSGFAASANSTQYYSSFNLTVDNSADVVNNHIPVDPVLGGAITLVKTSPLVNVTIGQLVPYTITATNTLSAPLSNIDLRDLLPPGFKYMSGSANLDGVSITPTLNGRVLSLSDLTFPGNGRRTIQILLVVGAGVQPGEYVNTAQMFNNLVTPPDNAVSNRATAVVRVIPDPVFDCSDVIGKVFDDQNANGYQDDGEPGIPSVRVATARGLLVTTDAEGRYHVTCAMVPNEFRGSNFIMKLDERTLPSGYRITTENPRTIHLTRGKMGKLNFGAAIHRVVRLEMTDAAFIADQNELGQELSLAIDTLPEQLRSAPSIVRLAYNQQNETNKLIRVRLKEVGKRIEELWEEQGCCYTLVFEEEIFQRNLQSKGGDK